MVGISGSGKTTLGRVIADRLGVPFTELDSIFHQPGWRPLPEPEFRNRVAAKVAGESWVIDGNYSAVRDLVWDRADTVVWFDLPRRTVMIRIIWRTLRRAVTRAELWNGNREPPLGMFRINPEVSVIRWAWLGHGRLHDRYTAAEADPANTHLTFIRIRSAADADALLERLDSEPR